MDKTNFEKIIARGIKDSPETLDFLKAQAREILDVAHLEWLAKQDNEEDIKDSNNWDYERDAYKCFQNFLHKWFEDVYYKISFIDAYEKLPYSIVVIFDNFIEEILENIDFEEFAYEIMEDTYHEYREKNIR